jgi:Na+-translocating ferredoxin:NAD+ oxidoreductase RnfG subunit
MKICILLVLLGFIVINAADIQSDVEDIIKSEFCSNCKLSLHKYPLPGDLKTQTENQVRQKFFSEYVYLWEICEQDSLKGFAILDNTYGKSLPITFLVIFSSDGGIRQVDIIRYREPYGGAIGSRNWLSQFTGKSGSDGFKVDKDIDLITGATISVNSVTRGVYKLTLMMEHIISENVFSCSRKPGPVESIAK